MVQMTEECLDSAFSIQKNFFKNNAYPSFKERKSRLKQLKQLVKNNIHEICVAIDEDFQGRSHDETKILDCFPSLQTINFAVAKLKSWMSIEQRSTTIWFQPAKNSIRYQPLGVTGIIVPWNCPLYLTISPLVSALAAGNSVIVKLPEQTPKFSNLFARLIRENFKPEILFAINGDVEQSKEFSKLPFDLLLFTGSTKVGAEIMVSAGENLTPVILELGGKSPVIIGEDANVEKAIKNIVSSKFTNAGQICIAPDHLYIPEKFIAITNKLFENEFKRQYLSENINNLTSLISERAFVRLKSLVDDAVQKGAELRWLNGAKEIVSKDDFPPVLITNVKENMTLMKEEIFGPILPIIFYSSFSDVLKKVSENSKPLAIYYFGKNKNQIQDIIRKTHSGALVINDTMLHVLQDDLPFGGVGLSGMGRYHGYDGFKAFSNAKSIMKQSPLSLSGLLRPPYTSLFKKKIIDIMLKL